MSKNKANYEDLRDAWWAMSKAMKADENESMQRWLSVKFEDVLKSCNWTVEEWNAAVAKEASDR